ncbi:hypothetical protein JCM3766R1_005782 [Sporobolomyces carnicolor]
MASVAAIKTLRTSRPLVGRLAGSLFGSSSVFASSTSRTVIESLATTAPAPASTVSVSVPVYTSSSDARAAGPATVFESLTSILPDSLAAGLRELLPPWVLAVPKRRTTHSAKRMRSANKHLKEKHNLVACPSCGAPKLSHHLCHSCHVAFRREYHREAKEEQQVAHKR